jgi:circadian clock protein KaiC
MAAQEALDIKNSIEKLPSGIEGFDQITGGGLPRGRTTLLLGGPGSGKTVFALQVLVNGAQKYGEPGVFVAFEEGSRQILENSASFGWNLPGLIEQKLFFLDARLSASAVKTGGFDLAGMLAGLQSQAEEMSAANEGAPARFVFDSIDVLLAHLKDPYAEREEIYRIHDWLAQRSYSGILTTKPSQVQDARKVVHDFAPYMADCVIELKREVIEGVSHRTLTVVKYRGSRFAENEFNVIIGRHGIEVPSLSMFDLDYPASSERQTTGIERLDAMLKGGYLRGSSVLITGAPGTAKSTMAGAFVAAACRNGKRALYVSFDEAPAEVIRNMSSVNIRLEPYVREGLLRLYSSRAEASSAVEHLVEIKRLLQEHQPRCVVIDPFSAMVKAGGQLLAKTAAQRLIYETKAAGITLLITSLLDSNDPEEEATPMEISTIADTWIHLSYLVLSGERNRALTVIKSRGTQHSNQVRELILSDAGVTLSDLYTAGGEVLMGTMRYEKEFAERRARQQHQAETERRRRILEIQQAETRSRLDMLQRELDAQAAELAFLEQEEESQERQQQAFRHEVSERRSGEVADQTGGKS